MSHVFISYRRDDAQPYARQLRAHLSSRFGSDRVFMDLEIRPGEQWSEVLRHRLETTSLMLVLIGPRWLDRDRLADREDWVRAELSSALARRIPLLPVRVGGAALPAPTQLPVELRALLDWQAIELSDERWDYDVARVVDAVAARLGLGAASLTRALGGSDPIGDLPVRVAVRRAEECLELDEEVLEVIGGVETERRLGAGLLVATAHRLLYAPEQHDFPLLSYRWAEVRRVSFEESYLVLQTADEQAIFRLAQGESARSRRDRLPEVVRSVTGNGVEVVRDPSFE